MHLPMIANCFKYSKVFKKNAIRAFLKYLTQAQNLLQALYSDVSSTQPARHPSLKSNSEA